MSTYEIFAFNPNEIALPDAGSEGSGDRDAATVVGASSYPSLPAALVIPVPKGSAVKIDRRVASAPKKISCALFCCSPTN